MEPFPDDVRQFLQSRVAAVEQLEILRVLGESPELEWTEDAMCLHVQVSKSAIGHHLHSLAHHGLIRLSQTPGGLCSQYGPQSSELEQQLRRLLDLYRQRPVTMMRLVYERPPDSLRAFSDAFRFRRDG